LDLTGVGAACWEPESGHADGASVANAFTNAARNLGVGVRIGPNVTAIDGGDAGVTGVRTQDGLLSTNTVVLAAGFRSSALLAPLGVELPMNPIRHSIVIVERTPGFGNMHPVVGDRVQLAYFRPEGAGMTLIGAHDPLEGDADEDVEAARRPTGEVDQQFAERLCNRFPTEVDGQVREGYTGVYDCTPDFQPALGKVEAVPGLHVAAGFSGHGFKLSPAVGKIMSEIVMDGRAALVDIDMFNIERFAKGQLIESPGGYASRTLA
jgi:glycine/D-amino acid oxidase-like deaminating enzyme